METATGSAFSPARVLTASAIAAGVAGLALLLWALGYVLLLVFAAILVSIFLRGLANLLAERTALGPGTALAVVMLVLTALITGIGFFLAPRINSQVSDLMDALPRAWMQVKDYIRTLPLGDRLLDQTGSSTLLPTDTLQSELPHVFSVTMGGAVQLVFVLVAGIYLAADPGAYIRGVTAIVPQQHRARACEVLGAVGYVLQWWLVGQVLIMIAVGAVTATGLALLGVPLALTLGLIAGLLDFVPNVGPIVAAIPAILVAVLSGPQSAVYVMILYLVIQQIEGYVLTPLVHRKTVSVQPAFILTAQLAFGVTAGVLGVLLATPLLAASLAAIKLLYIEDVLGDRTEVEGRHRAKSACEAEPE